MDEHLGKPFRVAELGELLAELIDASQLALAAGARTQATPIEPEPTAGEAPLDGEVDPSRPRVLVVDDNETNRRVARFHLARHPVAVDVVNDGTAALARLAAEPYDLVLLDGLMPGLDGPAVARELRRREAAASLPPIPIVGVTASILPEDRRRMLEAGMDGHIVKPLRGDELAGVLERWLPDGVERRSAVIPPAPAMTVAAGKTDPTILDVQTFERLSDLGDALFVERIVRLFLADAAERVAQVDDALETGDMLRLRSALHALEGICGNVGATALDRRARELHDDIRRREDRGEDPLGRHVAPSGLELLLDATRIRLQEQLAAAAQR
jgi:two-component system sensor histidine kinase BarA